MGEELTLERPSTALSDVSSASRMSVSRRQKLEALLAKEELKDAIVTRLQMENPNAAKDPALLIAAENEADKMVKNGASRPGTAMSNASAKSGFSLASARRMSRPGTANSRLTKDVKNILRASTPAALEVATAAESIAKERERVSFVDHQPGVPDKPAKTPSVSSSSTVSMGETAQMPVYSVAGKRHTLEELIHQKIYQTIAGRSKATGRDMFRVLDRAHNGRINQEQFRQFLMRYNIFVPHDQLMGLLKRYDDFGDGTMNLAQFIRHVLPPDYPDNYTPKPPTPELAALKAVIQKNAEDTGLEVEELPPEKPLPVMGLAALEKMIQAKVQQHTRGVSELRGGFRRFDDDADGLITKDKLDRALQKLNIFAHADDLDALMAKNDLGGKGAIDFYDFVKGVMPQDYPIALGTVKDHALVAFRRMKERVNRETETMRHAFKSVDVAQNGLLGRQELKYFCANENIDLEESSLDEIMAMSSRPDGKLNYNDFTKLMQLSEDNWEQIAAKAPGKNYFANMLPPTKPKPPAMLDIPTIEAMWTAKIMGKRNGVVDLRQAFRSMDRTGYTQINHEDLKTLLHHENIKVGDEELHQLFTRYDVDQDGLISWTDVEHRIIPPDFPTVEQEMTKSVEDKIHTQVHSLARLLGMRDRKLHGELTEYLPPAVIMEACMKVGVQMSDSQLEDLMNQCTMESGELDYLQLLSYLKHAYVRTSNAFVKSELAKRVKPKHKDKWAKARANKPKAMKSAAVKLTVEDIEAMIRDKIATRCPGGYHQMRNAFKHFNKDKNHFISFENFARTLREFELKLPPADIEALFRRYDRDGDGVISFTEFASLLMPTDREDNKDSLMFKLRNPDAADFYTLRGRLDKQDQARDGTVNFNQLKKVCKACKVDMTDDELRKMADECDAGNGRASVNKLSLALRRWQLYRVNQEPYNNPRTRLYSPTPRVHHDMPSRTVVVPPKRQQPVWPTEDDQNSQAQVMTVDDPAYACKYDLGKAWKRPK